MTQRLLKLATYVLPIAGLALAGCEPREETLPDSVTTALETAFNRGDIDGCVAVYAEDAEIIPEDGPVVRGKRGIMEFFKGQVARDISFDTDTTLNYVQGNLAVEQGTYRVRNVGRGVDVEYGDYLNVWRKSNGQWHAYRSMYNITMARRSDISVTTDEEPPQPTRETPPATRPPTRH